MLTKRRLKITGVLLGAALLIALTGALYFCHVFAQRWVHPNRNAVEKTPADHGLDYDTLKLLTDDGLNLAAWYIASRNGAAVILQHGGVGGTRAMELPAAGMLARHGYGVIMVDLRGMGESEGDTLTWGVREVRDADAAYRHLLTRSDVDPGRIGALGNSLGGLVLLMYAAQNPELRAVAAQGVPASLRDVFPHFVKVFTGLPPSLFAPPIRWFAEREADFDIDDVAPIECIGSISPRAVLLMQGGADRVIPPANGQRLYDAAGEPKELWFERDLGHGVFAVERKQAFEARVVSFFDRYLLADEP